MGGSGGGAVAGRGRRREALLRFAELGMVWPNDIDSSVQRIAIAECVNM